MDRKALVDVLRELVFTPGPSGFEDRVRRFVEERLRSYGYEPRTDWLGNLYVEVGSEGDPLLLAAHMDELGFIITGIEDSGLLTFRKLGGIDDRVLPGQHVQVLTEKGVLEGVIGITPPHLQFDRSEQEKVLKWSELRIDIGADGKEEAEALGVKVLDPAVFKKHWSTTANGRYLASRGFDDRVGVAILLELAKMLSEERPRRRIVLAWTVQEEVGLRGASYLASNLRPAVMVAVDTMACCSPQITGNARPGAGPVLRAVDNQYIAPRRLVDWLLGAAKRAGVSLQAATAGGTTDAAAFQRAGIPSVAIGILLKYTHSTAEMVNVDDIIDATRLLYEALTSG